MRNRDKRYEFNAGMKRNLDTRRRMRGNAKIEGILERERSRISSRYNGPLLILFQTYRATSCRRSLQTDGAPYPYLSIIGL